MGFYCPSANLSCYAYALSNYVCVLIRKHDGMLMPLHIIKLPVRIKLFFAGKNFQTANIKTTIAILIMSAVSALTQSLNDLLKFFLSIKRYALRIVNARLELAYVIHTEIMTCFTMLN